MLEVIHILQLVSGVLWLVPLILYVPAIARIWVQPLDKRNAVDVLVSPLAFTAALMVGYVIRWMLYPDAIVVMQTNELLLWSGLYTLSCVAAVSSALAWLVARRIR